MTNRASGAVPSEFEVGGAERDELFNVLSHPYRRFMLQYLLTAGEPTLVSELTTELVAWESQRATSDRIGDDRQGIGVTLRHCHLPKMAEADVIRYDAAQQTVTLGDRTDEVRTHL